MIEQISGPPDARCDPKKRATNRREGRENKQHPFSRESPARLFRRRYPFLRLAQTFQNGGRSVRRRGGKVAATERVFCRVAEYFGKRIAVGHER